MTRKLAELEHVVLLVAYRIGPEASAPEIGRVLESEAGRSVSRGALYQALERLANRGYLRWSVEAVSSKRPGTVRRKFAVTSEGQAVLAESRAVLLHLWDGIESRLGKAET